MVGELFLLIMKAVGAKYQRGNLKQTGIFRNNKTKHEAQIRRSWLVIATDSETKCCWVVVVVVFTADTCMKSLNNAASVSPTTSSLRQECDKAGVVMVRHHYRRK